MITERPNDDIQVVRGCCSHAKNIDDTVGPMPGHPFFKPRKYSPGATATIYLLLLGHLVLDTLGLILLRNLYFAFLIVGFIPAERVPRLGMILLIVALIGMFLHMAGGERSMRDLDFPRGILLYSRRVAGIQFCMITVIQVALIAVIPSMIGHAATILPACGALVAGVALLVTVRRRGHR